MLKWLVAMLVVAGLSGCAEMLANTAFLLQCGPIPMSWSECED